MVGEKLASTVDEVAQLLGISRSSAYQAVHSGEIPSLRIGRRYLVPKQALDEMLRVTPIVSEPTESEGKPDGLTSGRR